MTQRRASPSLLAHLKDRVGAVVARWPDVEPRRMFGSDVWLVGGHLCVLLMPYGRVVLRLPSSSAALLGLDGAAPWQYGTKQPKHWVVVPESFHDDEDELRTWMDRARVEVREHPPESAKRTRATTSNGRARRPRP